MGARFHSSRKIHASLSETTKGVGYHGDQEVQGNCQRDHGVWGRPRGVCWCFKKALHWGCSLEDLYALMQQLGRLGSMGS